jgi:hypothetical protein
MQIQLVELANPRQPHDADSHHVVPCIIFSQKKATNRRWIHEKYEKSPFMIATSKTEAFRYISRSATSGSNLAARRAGM